MLSSLRVRISVEAGDFGTAGAPIRRERESLSGVKMPGNGDDRLLLQLRLSFVSHIGWPEGLSFSNRIGNKICKRSLASKVADLLLPREGS